MPVFYSFVDLSKNELRNAAVQNLGAAPTSPVNGQLWYDSTNQQLKWWNGTVWVAAMSGGALTPAATVTTQAVGDAGVVGTSGNYAREDHKHGREAFGGTVTAETSFGLASSIGAAVTLPRSDHTHGTPTHDATAHSALLGNVTAESTYGAASNNGVATTISRSDHQHGNPALTANPPITQAIADSAGVGVSAFPARDDHKHGMPLFGAVTGQTLYALASTTGTSPNVAHADHAHGTVPYPDLGYASSQTAITRSIVMNNWPITGMQDPVNPQDAATKNYVDGAVNGLTWKAPCRAATTANITISGTQTVDGVALVAGDRCLVKNQTTGSLNGIYVVAAGAWTRSADSTTAAQLENEATYIDQGTTQQGTGWTMTTPLPITVGTTALTYVQFSGVGTYTAGNGLSLTGNIFAAVAYDTSINVLAGGIQVNTAVIATQAYVNTAVTGVTKKFAAALNGSASPETITHNLNTRDIDVSVINGNSPYSAVQVDWQASTVNTVVITYNPALGAGYRVVVIG